MPCISPALNFVSLGLQLVDTTGLTLKVYVPHVQRLTVLT